ncbi:MAG: DUF4249 domain-containing protein [Ekhidna sp.]
MRLLMVIVFLFTMSCEKVVIIELPPAQNLLVVEGWVTDIESTQSVRLIKSNGFLEEKPVEPITDANIRVERRNGGFQLYDHDSDGYYRSQDPYAGNADLEYRIVITLANDDQIRSDWDKMPQKTNIEFTSIRSFQENDPINQGQQITLYYPKVIAIDSAGISNFYRWVFFRGSQPYSTTESIVLQDDRFFDGNLIPNTFDEFNYTREDSMIVNLHSISNRSFEFLTLLKSQIATLGTSSITIPATVDGNFSNSNEDDRVLGYFGTAAISSDTLIAR